MRGGGTRAVRVGAAGRTRRSGRSDGARRCIDVGFLAGLLVAFTALAAGLAASVMPAEAARFTTVRSARNTTAIVIEGRINLGDERRFRNLVSRMREPPPVLLRSPGGNMYASLIIGSLVRELGLPTIVPPGAECASGCALIWLAGSRRFADPSAAIGFHSVSVHRRGVAHPSEFGNGVVMRYLAALGFSPRTARELVSAPPDSMLWLSQRTARNLGIRADTLRPSSPPPVTPGRAATGDALNLRSTF